MKKFKLYSEWRGVEIYGDNLGDAIIRHQNFQKPDRFAEVTGIKGSKVTHGNGAWIKVKRMIGIENTMNSTRGNDKFIRVIFELDDRSVVSFDAVEICVV